LLAASRRSYTTTVIKVDACSIVNDESSCNDGKVLTGLLGGSDTINVIGQGISPDMGLMGHLAVALVAVAAVSRSTSPSSSSSSSTAHGFTSVFLRGGILLRAPSFQAKIKIQIKFA
jgi:hypothetical protein